VTLRRLALFAPAVFILHVLEEARGFVDWFNGLVTRGITQEMFLWVNAIGLVLTVVISLLVAASDDPAPALALAAWVGFLMLGNGAFHIVATMVHARYCPGVITATLLYLPCGALLLHRISRERRLRPAAVLVAAALGSMPMLAHGYLIVFRASRLF
jgi:hypothetical protein